MKYARKSAAVGYVGTAVASAMLLLSGCSAFPTAWQASRPEPVVTTPDLPSLAIPVPKPPIQTTQPSRPVDIQKQLDIAIVLSNQQATYKDVADALVAGPDRYTIYDLGDKSLTPTVLFGQISDSNASAVVAIGLKATEEAIRQTRLPIIYSQVFNRQSLMLPANSRGVSALPPLDALLKSWSAIDPALARIGMIVGDKQQDLVTQAQLAAQANGLELVSRTSRSDQETLYQFKRMIRNVDGFWLFPDGRVLSSRVVKQMLAEAIRQHVPIAVMGDAILPMGAAISASTYPDDIAAAIENILRQISAGHLATVPPLTPLAKIRVTTNDVQAEKTATSTTAATAYGGDR